MPVSGYVLAGGRSSRMGQDKALLPMDGRTLLQHAVALGAEVCGSAVILSGPEGDDERNAILSRSGRLVPDRIPHCGPLSGVHAALCDSASEWSLILPVDAPFLPAALLRRWIEACAKPEYDASWMRCGEQRHPLPLLVRRSLRAALEEQLHAGMWSVREAVEAALPVQNVRRLAIFRVEPTVEAERWFANLNTLKDLQRWADILRDDNFDEPSGTKRSGTKRI